MDWLKLIWIILTVILILFPICYLLYKFSAGIRKTIKGVIRKVNNVKALDKMRNDLLRQSAKDTKDEIQQGNPEESVKDSVVRMVDEIVKSEEGTPLKTGQEVNNIKKDEELEKQEDVEVDKKALAKILHEADVLKKEGKLEEYEKKLVEGLSIDSNSIELNKNLAEYYFNLGNHRKALFLLKKVIEHDADDHHSIWHVGQIYLVTGDYHTAKILIEKAINLDGDNPKYHISMVEILYNTERKIEAAGIMEKVIKLRPSNTNYLIALAELYEDIGEGDNAKKYYFRVLENEPGNEIAKRKIQG